MRQIKHPLVEQDLIGIVEHIVDHAARAGCTTLALVAVNDSAGFWRRHGFRETHDPALAANLASYDDAARYMERVAG